MAEPVTYSGYLRLDQLLSAQQPRSSEHDEMLFIVIHQIYELWFKQLLHELGKLQTELEAGSTTHAMRTLRRTLAILKIVVSQLDVLETMTPTQFTRFRDWLGTSSGFESAQFRELEAVLGRRELRVLDNYPEDSPGRARISAALERPSLFDSFLRYLAGHGYAVSTERDFTKPIEPSEGVPWMPTPGADSPIQRVPRGLPGPGGIGFWPCAHGELGGYHHGFFHLTTIEKRPSGVGYCC